MRWRQEKQVFETRFSHADKSVITLHKPHPQPTVKAYVIKEVLEHLTEKGRFEND